MIKTYGYAENTQLSPHFKASEFRCKCGKNHDFKVDSELIEKLEKLREALHCSKIIVTSGFRCVAHDKNVGGSGSGQHTLGKAVDICCYDQDGQPISSKIVCCKAQGIGFTGIANITSEYKYTHVDVRSGKKWYGDETKGNSYVTDDFYNYFGISKAMNGIDVSYYQGKIDWTKVNVDFAILRAGYGKVLSQKDERFEEYYAGAKAAGIPVGTYWYSYATTVEEAVQEANVCLQVIKGKQFEFPIFFDMEEKKQVSLGKEKCSEIAKAFLSTVEKAGYWVGLYSYKSFLETNISEYVRKRYAVWVAHTGVKKTTYSSPYGMWQFSHTGNVNGISGNVDLNECYVDYPALIRKKGLNGFQIDEYHTVKKGETWESIAGSYGLPVEELLKLNPVSEGTKLKVK